MNKMMKSRFCRTNRLLMTIPLVLAITWILSASHATAQQITFDFRGIVQQNDLGLFGGKAVGEEFTGSFTVDPDATKTADFGTAADYDGSSFDLTIEGQTYVISVFNVWLDGVEFDTYSGSVSGGLSLRSTNTIYTEPAVPTELELADFDSLAKVSFFDFFNFEFSVGTITSITPRGNPPTISCPAAISSECNAPSSRDVTLSVNIADDDGDPLDVEWLVDGVSVHTTSQTQNATDSFTYRFDVGESIVQVRVSDGSETVRCATTVTIIDAEDPVVICAPDVVAATDPGECQAFNLQLPEPEVSDNCGVDSISNDAPAQFDVGETIVTWTVTDVGGNTATCTQLVIIEDREAPTITCPADIVADKDQGACGATGISLGNATTNDNCEVTSVSHDAPTEFPVGETFVTWTVIDSSGNVARCQQVVTVLNSAPIADAGSDRLLECDSAAGTELTLNATASYDPDTGDSLSYHWSAVGITFDDETSTTPTATFPLGSTTVTLVVSDQCGAMSSTDVIIVVEDNIAPQIEIVYADKQMLWPPNHKMIPVQVSMGVRDTCAEPDQLIVSCVAKSNEADDATGDGSTTGDVNGQDGFSDEIPIDMEWNAVSGRWEGSLELRAERNAKNASRKYSIDCLVADSSGNVTSATLCVVVPHNKKK